MNLVPRTVIKHGNSLAITLPSQVVNMLSIKAGDEVQVPFHLFKTSDSIQKESVMISNLSHDLRIKFIGIQQQGYEKNPRIDFLFNVENLSGEEIEIERVDAEISIYDWVDGYLGNITLFEEKKILPKTEFIINLPYDINYFRLEFLKDFIHDHKLLDWKIKIKIKFLYASTPVYKELILKFMQQREEFQSWLVRWEAKNLKLIF